MNPLGVGTTQGARGVMPGVVPDASTSTTLAPGVMPPPPSTGGVSTPVSMELPVLAPPVGGLSLETLMTAVGNSERKQACNAGVERIKLKANEQAAANEEKLQKIADQLEEMRSKSVLNGFLKAFKIIGMIIGAIASVASTVVGAVTGNPLLIAAGVMGMAMVVDGIMSEASDGKVCFMAGMTELGKACGMSDDDAKWFAFAMQMAVTVVMVGLSLGAGFANASSSAAKITSDVALKAFEATVKCQQIAQFANSALTTAQGAGTIAGAVFDYKIAMAQADAKELEAIMERVRQAIDFEQDFLESEMKRSEDLMGKLGEIVNDCNEAQAAILSGAPAMA